MGWLFSPKDFRMEGHLQAYCYRGNLGGVGGALSSGSSTPLEAPLTKTPCVWWHLTKKFLRSPRPGAPKQWIVEQDEEGCDNFFVEDETGAIFVRPFEGRFEIAMKVYEERTPEMHIVERALQIGTPIVVSGTVQKRPGLGAGLMAPGLLVTDEPLDAKRIGSSFGGFFHIGAGLFRLAFLLPYLPFARFADPSSEEYFKILLLIAAVSGACDLTGFVDEWSLRKRD